MRKYISVALTVLSVALLVFSIGFSIYAAIDISNTIHEISSRPSSSGVDYLGVGWGYALALFILSLNGAVISWISFLVSKNETRRFISVINWIIFLLMIPVFFVIFYI